MGGLYVVKRDGREEPVAFDKITARIKKLAYGLSQEFCDPVRGRAPRTFAFETASDLDDATRWPTTPRVIRVKIRMKKKYLHRSAPFGRARGRR